jgi:tetratricopeptide (TPR) repeat protein
MPYDRRWQRALPCGFGIVLLMFLMGVARADTPPSDADKEAAKIYYKAGEQYYLAGHYQDAIAQFNEAYRLSHASALLFNIAQACEKMGDIDCQRDFLSRYIESGKADPKEVPAMKAKVKELDEQIAARSNAKPPPETEPEQPVITPPPQPASTQAVVVAPAPTGPTAPTGPIETPPPTETHMKYGKWKWIALISGGGAAVISLAFIGDSAAMNKKIEDAAGTSPPTAYSTTLQGYYTRGQRDNALATVFGVAGVGLLTTGIVFMVLDKPVEETHGMTVVPVVTPTLAGAAASWTF